MRDVVYTVARDVIIFGDVFLLLSLGLLFGLLHFISIIVNITVYKRWPCCYTDGFMPEDDMHPAEKRVAFITISNHLVRSLFIYKC